MKKTIDNIINESLITEFRNLRVSNRLSGIVSELNALYANIVKKIEPNESDVDLVQLKNIIHMLEKEAKLIGRVV